jgi:hypothetical protein
MGARHSRPLGVWGPTETDFSEESAYTLPAGPYDVVYDGQHISYQPRGG